MVFLQSPMTYSERGGFGCKKSTRLQVFWHFAASVLVCFVFSECRIRTCLVFGKIQYFFLPPMFGAALNFRQNMICFLKV